MFPIINAPEIEAVIREGISYIFEHQSSDGGFISRTSFFLHDFDHATPRVTTFFASNILSCMCSVRSAVDSLPENEKVKRNLNATAKFLYEEKGTEHSWNYWARNTKERKSMPYPDDLDDTFSALIALRRYDAALISETIVASAAATLTMLEIQEGGPYKTWLVGPNSADNWKDVDVVVNSNIAYFLSLAGVHLPNLERFFDGAIENKCLTSPYYPGFFQVAYFMSRSYRGKYMTALAAMLAEKLMRHRGAISTLERAMAISTLINLGSIGLILDEEIAKLIQAIGTEGWQPSAFCIDPARDGKTCYAGASALTAAFCMEALAKYSEILADARKDSPWHLKALHRRDLAERIRMSARKNCEVSGKFLRKTALEKIKAVNDEKILLLAHDFRKALGKAGEAMPEELIEHLCVANLYGWLAYTIYDDCLDDASDPLFLPVANLFARELTREYVLIDRSIPGAMRLFKAMMDEMDNANAWEQIHCRLPKKQSEFPDNRLPMFADYENLASRSIGHALGPLTELLRLGYARTSKEFLAVESFFRDYLIARQLHDDAHDWAQDLAHGRINSVATLILEKNRNNLCMAEIVTAIPKLRHHFWEETIDNVVQKIVTHTTMARAALQDIPSLDQSFMKNELATLVRTAEKTLNERDKAREFLKQYQEETVRES